MITNPLYSDNGNLFAFEIENIYISIGKIEELLKNCNGVSEIRPRKLFSNESSDVHIKFKYLDDTYIVLEPYGDSSEYWIGPENDNVAVDISRVKQEFDNYKPQLLVKAIGDILTLNFKSLFKRS